MFSRVRQNAVYQGKEVLLAQALIQTELVRYILENPKFCQVDAANSGQPAKAAWFWNLGTDEEVTAKQIGGLR